MRELAPMLYLPSPKPKPWWISVSVLGENEPRGGLIGLTIGAWFSIELLWLPEDLRGHGVGSAVLAEAEKHAKRRGCIGAYTM